MFLSTSEKSPLPENCCGHEERQQVKKQPLYRWLRLVFSQNAYGFFLHIEFVLSITEFTFKMCNFPLLVGFVIAWIDYGNVAVVVTVLWLPSGKDRKVFAKDLKTIYQAVNEEKALEALDRVTKKRASLTWVFLYASYINKSCKLISWIYSSITYHRMSIYRLYFTHSNNKLFYFSHLANLF